LGMAVATVSCLGAGAMGGPAMAAPRAARPVLGHNSSGPLPSTALVERAKRNQPGTHVFGMSLKTIKDLVGARHVAQHLNRQLNIVNIYTSWSAPFPASFVNTIRAAGAVPEVTWEPWIDKLGTTGDTYPLSAITSGRFNSYITDWAKAAAAWKGLVLLRFAQEMNGNWYPWSIGNNGNTAADYVRAYQHIHDLFVKAGATNVLWIWSPNVMLSKASLAPDYPGASFVDFVGLDGYNFGTGLPKFKWVTPEVLFGPTFADVATFAPTKPILITETGSSEQGGSKADWIQGFVSYMAGEPHVVGFVWTEYDGKADWPIESSTAAEAAMRAALVEYWGAA
jgi:hypothetical protein